MVGMTVEGVNATSDASPSHIPSLAVPELGQLVLCRDRHWIGSEVQASQLPHDPLAVADPRQHLVTMSSVEDDGLGETLSVVWELEPSARTLATATLPEPRAGRFDPPELLFEVTRLLKQRNTTAPVRVVVTDDCWTSGPLQVTLELGPKVPQ